MPSTRFTPGQRAVVAFCAAIAMVVTACGSANSAISADSVDTSAATDTDTTAPDAADTSTITDDIPSGDGPTNASDWMAADELVPFADAADSFTPPQAGDSPTEHLEAMLTDIFDNTTADNRQVDAEMFDLFAWRTEQGLPDLVINTMSAIASLRAERYDIVAGYMEAGADAEYGAEATRWFEERALPARTLADRNLAALDVLRRAHEIQLQGRRCFAGADETERICDDQPTAVALLDELDTIFADRVDLPDDVSAYDDTVDACTAWDNAVTGQSTEVINRLELSMYGDRLDTRFIGRTECRYVETGEDEIEHDQAAGTAAFESVFDALATATSEPVDGATADSVPQGRERDPAATAASLQAGLDAAHVQLDGLIEPNARLAMLSVVLRGNRELARRTQLDDAENPAFERDSEFDEVVPCIDSSDPEGDWLAACEGDERTLAEYHVLYGIERYVGPVDAVVDWRDIDNATDYCTIWEAQRRELDDGGDELSSELYDVRELFGTDEC